MSQDHFSANLDQEHDDRTIDAGDSHAVEPDDAYAQETKVKRKLKIPAPVLIVGAVVLCMIGGVTYKKMTTHSAAQETVSQVSELPPDNGGGGMMPSNAKQSADSTVTPLPSDPQPRATATGTQSVTPQQPLPAPSLPPAVSTAAFAAPATPATPLIATNVQIPVAAPAAAEAAASSVGALLPSAAQANAAAPASLPAATRLATATDPDPKDAEIASLRRQLRDLSHKKGTHAGRKPTKLVQAKSGDDSVDSQDVADTAQTNATTAAPTKVVRHSGKKHGRIEVQLGYHIKQVIPGQGWVEDESSGKQIVVATGDKIGGAEVTKIDADASKIYTTAGVIQ